LPDEASGAADAVLDRVILQGGVVPYLFRLEFANAMTMAIRRNRVPVEARVLAFSALDDLQLATDMRGAEFVWTQFTRIADAHRLTLYDAAYLELALRLDLPLATFDKSLTDAARRENVRLA
jgi:predicted nucleic acid-binding protein